MKYSELYSECTLCPRRCALDRNSGERGFCSQSSALTIARASLHEWEEPCISGERGSGTVFFSGCPLHCVYCQNNAISRGEVGRVVDGDRLCEIFFELGERGAHNVNLVTPTHFLPHVIYAIEKAKGEGFALPFVYNTSGYESFDALRRLDGLIDIYLPDFKYFDSSLAKNYSCAEDYPEIAKKALAEMVRQRPTPTFDSDGMMTSGVIVRHLLLPSHYKNSREVIEYLYKTYGDSIYISIMSQYTPVSALDDFPELMRPVKPLEYERLVRYAISLGVENAFIQDGSSASESFIPQFDCFGV